MPAYFRPGTLDEALEICAARPVAILAGGTDVYPAKAARVGWGDMRHPDVLDISAIKGLRGISEEEVKLRFGALTTWTDLKRAALPPAFAGYQAAAHDIGGAQVQNRGTLVGNICTASPAGDGIPCLLTLDSEVELQSLNGRRIVPIGDFINGYRSTVRRPDEIVTALLFPKPAAGARGRFLKLGARRYLVISIVMAAAVLATDEDGIVTAARVAVGACTPVATRLPALEQALKGVRLSGAGETVAAEHLSALSPIDDVRASGAFRQSAALDLLRDLLTGFAVGEERKAA
jgi:xanthine dehydrogenase small subunit